MQKYRGVLPPKYVFRLPTEAELHYAYWAGADDMSTDSTVIDDIVTTTGEALAELGLVPKVNVWNWKNYPREYSGLYLATLPNANEFGVVPWVAGYRELWILDTVKCMDLRDSLVSRRNQIKEIMNYADEEIDPLRTGDHYVGVRGDRDHSKVRFVKEFADNFLIVIGPDLESEKKAAGK